MARTQRQWVERMAERASEEHDRLRKKLVYDLRYLAERLTRTAERMEADSDYTHNSLGEVQSSGLDVDRTCAELRQAREYAKQLRELTNLSD